MRIKVTEDKISHGRNEFFKDDERTVPDDVGEYFCSAGWATDLDGGVATGERSTTEAVIVPESVVLGLNSTEAK